MKPDSLLKICTYLATFTSKLTAYMESNKLKHIGLIKDNVIFSNRDFKRNVGYRKGIADMLAIGRLENGNRIGIAETRAMNHILDTNFTKIENVAICIKVSNAHTLVLNNGEGEIHVPCNVITRISAIDQIGGLPVINFELKNISFDEGDNALSSLKREWFSNIGVKK